METHTNRPCPACGQQHASPVLMSAYSQAHWRIVACTTCRMVYLENPPEQATLMAENDWQVTSSAERIKRRENRSLYYFFSDGAKKVRDLFRRLRKRRKEVRYVMHFSPGPRILDVGCGDGVILEQLPSPFVPLGIEPSPGLQAIADARYRTRQGKCIQDVAVSGFATFGADSVDCVLMRSFLEHDSEAFETLKAAHGSLSAKGCVIIKVPNFACWNAKWRKTAWPGMRYPDHVNYFTPKTLALILKRAGYSRVSMPWHWQLPTSDNLWAVAFR